MSILNAIFKDFIWFNGINLSVVKEYNIKIEVKN